MTVPTTAAAPIKRRLLRDEAYEQILGAILDGTLEAGEELHADALQTWLGTSRTPLREALTKLAEDGVVELVAHKYTRVAPLDFRVINEGMFASGVLHEFAARQVVGKMDAVNLKELRAFAKAAATAQKKGDIVALGPAIRDFFLVFEQATGNKVLVDTVESLNLQLLRFLTPREELLDTGLIVEQITRIAEAAESGDAQRTGDLIHALYEPTRRNFLTVYRDM
ncbi:GntR family transcriptional regulator [Microbacterium oxydans]|uniref:GntR family transcriptional regulator n=1 Tax=Microbacterium oxydans TaxID=82380 RepID=UPI00226AFF52|nr:GntR family transcriptional regulator [Microbacterium oxydans]WAA65634.1 GntR family transcriptional regulator [Microbacterium oxydans]